jgi:hypothetical protein
MKPELVDKQAAPDPAKRVGVDAFLIRHSCKPDLFEEDHNSKFAFPCCACVHREREYKLCEECRHA